MMRLVCISDLHCGHRAGLTPPGYGYGEDDADVDHQHFRSLTKEGWDFFSTTLKALQPIDTLVVVGDAIDGKGERAGGTEQFEHDRLKQCEIAARCIEEAKAKRIYIIRGTPYHTGREEDFEDILGDLVGAAHVGAHDWIDCDGVVFDFKHKVGTSSVPHGRYTALARSTLWNSLWAEREMQPKANVIVRAHAHYFRYCGDGDVLSIVMPALQLWTKYGAAECEGTTDFGLVSFDCEGGRYSWRPHRAKLMSAKAEVLPA